MSPQEFHVVDIAFYVVETFLLVWLIRQGQILIRNDREKLELDREQHRMAKERYEERAKWRREKQKQSLKKNEPSQPDVKNTESRPSSTIDSENPKDGAAQSVVDTKASSKSV